MAQKIINGEQYDIPGYQTLVIQTTKVVESGATSAQSAAVGATTERVILAPTKDCWVAIGANPTAAKQTAGSFFLAGGSQSYPITVTKGVTKVAVIQDTEAGYLSIIESI